MAPDCPESEPKILGSVGFEAAALGGPTVHFTLRDPTGVEVKATLLWSDGIDGRHILVSVGGREFALRFKEIITQDTGVTYTSWVPVACTSAGEVVLSADGQHGNRPVWTCLGDGWHGRVELEHPKTPKRTHPEGRQCRECGIFDQQTGKDMFTRITHQYVNGGLSQLEWEVYAEAQTRKAAPLTESNVGWCYLTKALVARNSPACEEHFHE